MNIQTRTYATRFFLSLALLFPSASSVPLRADLVAYWSFDDYVETGDNPLGTPQGNHEGFFEDLSGNAHTAYAADMTNGNYVPTGPGLFGNGFYSRSPETDPNRGAMAVVPHSDLINFDGEDFTISFWEKVKFRDVASAGWADGRGRTQWFTKAPYLSPGTPGVEGYGLNLTQNRFAFLGNDASNFGQTELGGATFTYPSGGQADDSNQWAHWAITGIYQAGTDDYSMTIYLNASPVDWNGAVGTTFVVPREIIDNEGDLTIGGFFRNNDVAHQRSISWNMRDSAAGDTDGEGWMDDFALWDELLDEDEIRALADGSANPLTVSGGAPQFQVTEIIRLPDNRIQLTWNSKPNRIYSIFWSLDLTNFDTELEDGIDSGGETTTQILNDPAEIIQPGGGITTLFLRVVENP